MANTTFPLLYWIISCFDKRRDKPLPVYNRIFSLDWSELSEAEQTEVLGIVRDPSKESKHKPVGFDSAVVTMSHGPSKSDRRMIKFRPHFKLLSDDEFKKICKERPRELEQANITGEYFEDETGRPITDYEMMQHVTGQEYPIIAGDARSVLRLGPIAPKLIAEWSVAMANTIAHFIEVIQKIAASAWYRGQKSITYEVKTGDRDSFLPKPADARLLEAIFPYADETTAVLAYFRQLHAKDKLLVEATEAYLKHCNHGGKRFWVEHEKQGFVSAIDAPPGILETKRTQRRILQLFMYGAGLLHSTSNNGADIELAEFIEEHGEERAVAIFNGCLMRMFGSAAPIYHVIKQEFDHWLTHCSLAPPDRTAIDELFQNYVAKASVTSTKV